MPIRRAVNSKKETAPKNRHAEPEPEVEPEVEKKDAEVSSEESASTGEEQETETPPATSSETEQPKDPEADAAEEKEESKPSEDTKKDAKDSSKEKEKKVKKSIPIWATLTANQLARAQKVTSISSTSRPKMDAILTEALKACFHKSGASVVAIRKYIIKKYPSLDLERRGFLLKQALKRELQRGMIRQVKGKGASGSFVVVANAGKTAKKSKGRKSGTSATPEQQNVKLEDILPLAFTRICEPKEASYGLIKKYITQYYPKLNVDARPHMLKNAIQRAVEKGQLEQITGKGASGTFQLKRSGDKPLLGGSLLEDAILSAITAMNEPKTCSTTAIKKYVLENHPGTNSSFQVHLLKRTLQKCEKNGWLDHISGKGFSGTYMLSFPYYPNPDVLFPDKRREEEESSEDEDSEAESSEEEESSSEEESEEDEPPRKKRMQKKISSRGRPTAPLKRQVTKPKPKRGPPKPRGNIKSAPKKVPQKAPPKAPPTPTKKAKPAPSPAKITKSTSTPAKKARPAPAKKPVGSSEKKHTDVDKESTPPSKGKSNMRKSQRGK
ncbi:heterochromatin protein 1-binding protein 3 isoform X2 [Ambystoma mexicanum]|uniref:heterochromatin protein 1-binding protein 3 isoform X2 n=1 Tax=Ambystoma mexicanum TaxID=8296 RepID=UPI0037E85517